MGTTITTSTTSTVIITPKQPADTQQPVVPPQQPMVPSLQPAVPPVQPGPIPQLRRSYFKQSLQASQMKMQEDIN